MQDFEFHFLELPKFTKKKLEEISTIIEQWCYFLKNTKEDTIIPENFQNIIKEAFETVERHNFTEQEIDAIDYWEQEEFLNYSKGKNDGKKEGIQEGMKK